MDTTTMRQPILPAAVDDIAWRRLRHEGEQLAAEEPVLATMLRDAVLRHASLEDALAHRLAAKLASFDLPATTLRDLIGEALASSPTMRRAVRRDLAAAVDRDPAALGHAQPFLHHKGFLALQAHRVAHCFWQARRRALALHLQSRTSEVFAVDIHPAARVGEGVFVDHATGVVIGETAVVGDEVSMLQGVTLGGTGKERGDRHPKIGARVLLSAGATVLGNIRVGAGAKVGAGSVVLHDVPPCATVVGVPGKVVAVSNCDEAPGLSMDQAV